MVTVMVYAHEGQNSAQRFREHDGMYFISDERRIVAYLEGVQEKVKALKEAPTQTGTELQRLEQAILDRAFRGEL